MFTLGQSTVDEEALEHVSFPLPVIIIIYHSPWGVLQDRPTVTKQASVVVALLTELSKVLPAGPFYPAQETSIYICSELSFVKYNNQSIRELQMQEIKYAL